MPALTANASANVKNRVHEIRLMATGTEQITANFRGALNPGETLSGALWESDDQTSLGIVSGTVSASDSKVVVNCSRGGGHTYLRCQVTTTGGRTLNQVFYIMVSGGVFEDGAQSGTGRIILVVT